MGGLIEQGGSRFRLIVGDCALKAFTEDLDAFSYGKKNPRFFGLGDQAEALSLCLGNEVTEDWYLWRLPRGRVHKFVVE